MEHYAALYRKELLENVIPFWTRHSRDTESGGYFTCLDRFGSVYDTDKFIWLQGRQVWMFSTLYNSVAPKEEWLEMALHGASFLERFGRSDSGDWYFSLTREGKPLVQPYNVFSDCFASMGFGALYTATQDPRHAELAVHTFHRILERRNNPKGKYSKAVPGTRDLRNFSLPMILCNLSLEMEHLLGTATVNELVDEVLHEVLEVYYQKDKGLILENVYADGSPADCFEGRLINPGHGIESMWFIMDLGVRLNRPELVTKALQIAISILEYGWDKTWGGIFYFLDLKGNPPQQLEWDQKLWWVHVEALVCLAKGYQLTGSDEAAGWFRKVHEYTWDHFRDPEYGEWFGYLNRRGEVLLELKGGKWKGCFHIPRALLQVSNALSVHKKPPLTHTQNRS